MTSSILRRLAITATALTMALTGAGPALASTTPPVVDPRTQNLFLDGQPIVAGSVLPAGATTVVFRMNGETDVDLRTLELLQGTTVVERVQDSLKRLPNGRKYAYLPVDFSDRAPGTYTLRESVLGTNGRVYFSDRSVTLRAFRPEELIAVNAGNRLPRADLKVITGAEAASLPDITAHLVKDQMTTAVSHRSHDVTFEAVRKTHASKALVHSGSGTYPTYENVTLSALERDAAGVPVRLHQVNRLQWQAVKVKRGDYSWGNDHVQLGSGGAVEDSQMAGHNLYDKTSTDEVTGVVHHEMQHADTAQIEQGSGQIFRRNVADNRNIPAPRNAAGEPVPGSETVTKPAGDTINEGAAINGIKAASATLMLNRPASGMNGWYIISDNYSLGGTSVHFNITLTSTEWPVVRDADGKLTKGLELERNVGLERPANSRGIGNELISHRGFPLSPTNVRLNPDGTTSPWSRQYH